VIQVICFSRARPLQLHGYLTSLYANWEGDVSVSVLVRFESPYQGAYSEVEQEFPQVRWCHETDFGPDLTYLLTVNEQAEYTCFGCDDVVYVAPVSIEELAPEILGFSLRMGAHITRDMFGAVLPQPQFKPAGVPVWDFRAAGSIGDWAYPWEVLGTVYRTDFVRGMAVAIGAGSPSQLEERGTRLWRGFTDLHHMASYPTVRLVVPTVNVVQQEFPNGIVGKTELTPEFLLDCWNSGLRLDTDRYKDMAPDSWRVPDFYLRRV
jgi:hypothetical protein